MAKKYFVDTSSLIDLLEDYPPSAANKKLYKKIKAAFMNGTCILLESVVEELENNQAKGIPVLKKLAYLKQKRRFKIRVKVKAQGNIDIPKEIYKKMDPDWIADPTQRKLANGELDIAIFIKEKDLMVKGADFQLIFAAMECSGTLNPLKSGGSSPTPKIDEGVIVTEENRNKDRKPFKKIPQIADTEGIECIDLSEMLDQLSIQN